MAETKKVLLINAHLTYPKWTEGKLNDSFLQIAKDFFASQSFEIFETTLKTVMILRKKKRNIGG
jgi:modulator of drug activity B